MTKINREQFVDLMCMSDEIVVLLQSKDIIHPCRCQHPKYVPPKRGEDNQGKVVFKSSANLLVQGLVLYSNDEYFQDEENNSIECRGNGNSTRYFLAS